MPIVVTFIATPPSALEILLGCRGPRPRTMYNGSAQKSPADHRSVWHRNADPMSVTMHCVRADRTAAASALQDDRVGATQSARRRKIWSPGVHRCQAHASN